VLGEFALLERRAAVHILGYSGCWQCRATFALFLIGLIDACDIALGRCAQLRCDFWATVGVALDENPTLQQTYRSNFSGIVKESQAQHTPRIYSCGADKSKDKDKVVSEHGG
jgi:hypothetical protein